MGLRPVFLRGTGNLGFGYGHWGRACSLRLVGLRALCSQKIAAYWLFMNCRWKQKWRSVWLPMVILGLLFLSPQVLGCATCYGQSDSNLAKGMNWGILTMIFVVYLVIFSIIGFFVFVVRRSALASVGDSTSISGEISR